MYVRIDRRNNLRYGCVHRLSVGWEAKRELIGVGGNRYAAACFPSSLLC
jgi:hypothetical protein